MEPHTPLLLLNPRAPVPKAAPLHFEHTLAQRQLGTHPLWGPHGGAVIFQPHSHSMPLQGQPRKRPPSEGCPAPATPGLSCRQRHSGAGHGVGSPALGGGAGSALAHAHGPHTRDRTPRRAHARTPELRHNTPGPQTGFQRLRVGTQPDSPPKAPSATPPRPAPRTRQSGRRSVGCKVCIVRQSSERAGGARLGSTRLRTAVTAGPAAWMHCAQRCRREPIPLPRVGSQGLSASHADPPTLDEVRSQP